MQKSTVFLESQFFVVIKKQLNTNSALFAAGRNKNTKINLVLYIFADFTIVRILFSSIRLAYVIPVIKVYYSYPTRRI